MTGGTPATVQLDVRGMHYTLHPYHHDARVTSYGEEAAGALGVDPERIFKTLIVTVDGHLACGVVPVAATLSLKAIAAALKGKKAEMANAAMAQRFTGYVLGGISPLGHKRSIPLVFDLSIAEHDTVFVSAGKRGLQLQLAADDLLELTGGTLAPIAMR